MKKTFESFFNYPENSNVDAFSTMNFPINLNNVDYFTFCQKDIFKQNNSQFSDYDEDNEQEVDFSCIDAKNSVSYCNESNFDNIFSFEKLPTEKINHVFTENDNNKEDEISKKIKEMINFSRENNYNENNNELDFLNSKNYSLKNDSNNDINSDIIDNSNNSSNRAILGKPAIEINEQMIASNIINKKLEKVKIKGQSLEIDYPRKFQLFNKGTNNKYVNEIINLINNKEKNKKKLFKIYSCGNENAVKLVGRKRKNKSKKRGEKPDDIRKKLKSRRSEERRVGKECRSRWSPYH